MLTGTDEHGEKMVEAAESQGLDPQSLRRPHGRSFPLDLGYARARVRPLHPHDRRRPRSAPCSTSGRRSTICGEIELRDYSGRYCVGCERYLTERELENGLCVQHQTDT